MTYTEKKAVADAYIAEKIGSLGWEDLEDINSLNDCDSQEDIFAACDARIENEGLEGFIFSE